MLEIKTLPAGLLATNCYLVLHKESGTLYIIDPGGDAPLIASEAKKIDYTRLVILLTHAHFDHIGALGELKEELKPEKIYLNSADLELYHSPMNAMPPYFPAVKNLPEPDTLFSADGLEIIPLPGHTQGGVGFYFPAEKVLFSGDTLFCGSVGRTDLPGGNWGQLLRSIREKLLTLPPEVKVYPGHDEPTTIAAEHSNPYLRG